LVLWLISQAFLLATMPVLRPSSLRQAWKALGPLALKHPLELLGLGMICCALLFAGVAVLPLGILLAFACAAVLACRAVAELTERQSMRARAG
jgi:hypothetical protein